MALTLVAAYRSAGVPILLGDFLISQGSDRHRGRKKVSRIRENLAVGWTGNLLQAEDAIERLLEGIGDKPTKESIETWFSKFEPRYTNPDLKLAGWICQDPGEFCFLWDAAFGHVVWNEEWCIGSGGPGFEANLLGRYSIPLDPGSRPQKDTALRSTLAVLALLNCTDRISQEGHDQGVGGGYEALYWSEENRAFEYLSKALYFVLAVWVDGSGALRREPKLLERSVTTYEAPIAGEQSALTFAKGDGRDVWVMSAVGLPTPYEEVQTWVQPQLGQRMDFRADFYGGMLIFAGPNSCPPALWTMCPWDSLQLFRGTSGRFELSIPPGAIERTYQKQRESHAAAPRSLRRISLNARR